MSEDSLMNENEPNISQQQSMKSSRLTANLDEHIKLVKQKKDEFDHLRLQRFQEQLRKKEQKSYVIINNNKSSSFLTTLFLRLLFRYDSAAKKGEKKKKKRTKRKENDLFSVGFLFINDIHLTYLLFFFSRSFYTIDFLLYPIC